MFGDIPRVQWIWTKGSGAVEKPPKFTKHCKTNKECFSEIFIENLMIYNICNEKDNGKDRFESGIADKRLTKSSVGNVESARNVVGSNNVGVVRKSSTLRRHG